jgi:hypothetical protein
MERLKSIIRVFFITFLITFISTSFAQDTKTLSAIINSVNSDSLINTVKTLSGVIPFINENTSITILTRHSDYQGNTDAAQYLFNKLKSYNLSPVVQSFSLTGKNILAVQNGSESDKYVIICAHYDCCGNRMCKSDSSFIAPGADDNASGAAAVLECARIISSISSKYSIIYALWDEEEQGLLGSKYYASIARSENKNIIAVVNLDMIAWDNNNDGKIEIHVNNSTDKVHISDSMMNVNNELIIGLNPVVIRPGSNASDQYFFWLNNYDAVMLIEGYTTNDFNPYYHSKMDSYDKFNRTYFLKASKLAIATVAKLSEVKNITSSIPKDKLLPGSYVLHQNYPNPVNGNTIIEYALPADGYVKMDLFNVLGQKIKTIISEFKYAGTHREELNILDLVSGIYFYKLSVNNFVQIKKAVVIK